MRQRLPALTISVLLTLHPVAAHAAAESAPNAAATSASAGLHVLTSRIAPPDGSVIARFEAAGMRDVRPHTLTPRELARVEAALARLPALHRGVLHERLRYLSFVDGLSGAGTGLTSMVGETGQFDITLRAGVLNESLTQFLSAKEARLFAPDASGHAVTVEAAGVDALTYVLLHEATHIVDSALQLSRRPDGALTRDVWEPASEARNAWGDRSTLLAPLAASPAAATGFRGARPIPVSRARTHYDALARTPFVSMYATAAAAEDLAELVSWHVIATRYGGALTISVRGADGVALRQYAPLAFPAVRARLPLVDQLLGETGHAGAR